MAETGEITRDTFFGGRLSLDQPAKGHRSGTDAVLLAASVPHDFCGHVVDIGAGVGAVGLGIALACPGIKVTLVENDATCAALAGANIATNGLSGRASVIACDILCRDALRTALAEPADLVVTNPPFHESTAFRLSPDAGRRAAHVLPAGHRLADWIKACLDGLVAGGALILLHRADAVPELLAALDRRVGEVTLKPIHPRADHPASRVVVRARKGSRAPFRLAHPLVLHGPDGFTTEAAALHAGIATLAW